MEFHGTKILIQWDLHKGIIMNFIGLFKGTITEFSGVLFVIEWDLGVLLL